MARNKPACWGSAATWIEWQQLNIQAGSAPGRPLDHYCTDCTPEYKNRMVVAHRCAYPDVVFAKVMQRQRDPATGKMFSIDTGSVRGRRNPEDEAAWNLRHDVRRAEKEEE